MPVGLYLNSKLHKQYKAEKVETISALQCETKLYFSRAVQGKEEAWRGRGERGWLESQTVDCCICCHSMDQCCQWAGRCYDSEIYYRGNGL